MNHDELIILSEEIKKSGGLWEDKPAVVDGNLVTARHPNDLPDFMRAIVKLIKKRGII